LAARGRQIETEANPIRYVAELVGAEAASRKPEESKAPQRPALAAAAAYSSSRPSCGGNSQSTASTPVPPKIRPTISTG